MKGIRLVTRADDAGINRTANKAIRSSVRQGIVRNISLLAPGPEIESAVDTLGDLAQEVDFGLHVCITAEWLNLRWGPVAEASRVTTLLQSDDTFAYDCAELEGLSPNIEEMMIEVAAQYDKLKALGFPIRYLDAHMGVGRVAGLSARLTAFAEQNGLLHSEVLAEKGKISRVPGWPGPGEHPGTELADHLAGVQKGTYLLVGHPEFKTDEVEELRLPGHAMGEVLLGRNRERRMFADIEIVDYCENVGIELLRYSDL
jgi:chitin disaccharide deacetylase